MTQQNYPQATFVSVLNNPSTQSEKDRIAKLFPKRTMIGLSIAHLVFAGIAALTQVILISNGGGRTVAVVGTGLWTGLFFAISGGIGLVASRRPSYCMITAFMVFSIISSLFAIPLMVFSGIGLGEGSRRYYNSHYRHQYGPYGYMYDDDSIDRLLNGTQMLIGLAEGIIAIITAIFCCRVNCSKSPHRHTNVAFTTAGPQFTEIPMSPLPTSSGATQQPNFAPGSAVGQAPYPAPFGYQGNKENEDDPLGLQLQGPWGRPE